MNQLIYIMVFLIIIFVFLQTQKGLIAQSGGYINNDFGTPNYLVNDELPNIYNQFNFPEKNCGLGLGFANQSGFDNYQVKRYNNIHNWLNMELINGDLAINNVKGRP